MNPTSSVLPAPKGLVQDIKPQYQPPVEPVPVSVKAEVVASIPVRNPSAAPSPTAAVQNPMADHAAADNPQAAKELDQILKDVNQEVKRMDEPAKARFSYLHLKSANLILPVAAAVLVAIILTVATVIAFRPSTGHIRTRATASANL